MRKLLIVIAAGLLLSGCTATGEMETVNDGYDFSPPAVSYSLQLTLPEGASTEAMTGETGTLYFCDQFTVSVQKFPGGDLNRTLSEVTGMGRERLSVLKTEKGGVSHYRIAWSAAGEGTQQSCSALILDDGEYHHAVTVMADYGSAGSLQNQWNSILDSVQLVSTG